MKNGERLKIEMGWLEKALQIEDEERRELFLFTCIGKAMRLPQYEGIAGFVWPEVQDLWMRTKIVPLSEGKDAYIEFR